MLTDDVLEHVAGPVHGFYIAGYCISTPAGHYAYAKLCKEHPEDAWASNSAVAKVVSGPWAQSAEALCAATWRACSYAASLAASGREELAA
jgi:hypothetical protein